MTNGDHKKPLGSRVHERLSAVERDVQHLGEEITDLKSDLGLLKTSMDAGFSTMRHMLSEQKTPLAQLAGWAAVILTIVGAILYPQIRTDARLEESLSALLKESNSHHTAFGHVGAVRQFDDLDRRLTKVRDQLTDAKISTEVNREITRWLERMHFEGELGQDE